MSRRRRLSGAPEKRRPPAAGAERSGGAGRSEGAGRSAGAKRSPGAERARGSKPAAGSALATPASRPRLGPRLATDAAVLIGVLGLVTLISELAGAANLGVSLGIGTIAYAVVLMVLMLRR